MKRLLALFMAAIGLSASALAVTIDLSDTDLASKYNLAANNYELVVPDGAVLTGTLPDDTFCKVSIAAGATVTLRDVIIDQTTANDGYGTYCAGISCLGKATIILEGSNRVTGGYGYPGIFVPVSDPSTSVVVPGGGLSRFGDAVLTIKANFTGDCCGLKRLGSLTATGTGAGAGIGCGSGADDPWNVDTSACGHIVIENGTITAQGGTYGTYDDCGGAGIGSLGYDGYHGDIVIKGGNITARGGENAPGIGGGSDMTGHKNSRILIFGGTVSAYGGGDHGDFGPGIGSFSSCALGDILIRGGSVYAEGGDWAPGIGAPAGSPGAQCGNITIEPGVAIVGARAGSGASPIGAVGDATCGTITVPRTANGYSDTTEGVERTIEPTPWDGNLTGLTRNVVATDGMTITGTLSSDYKVSIADGAWVTLDGVRINGSSSAANPHAGITCLGDAYITLEGDNYVRPYGTGPAAIAYFSKTVTLDNYQYISQYLAASYSFAYVLEIDSDDGTLDVGGALPGPQLQGARLLDANNNYGGAGLGAGVGENGGDLVINGGTISATGGYGAAGIGGAHGASSGSITILGGTISATGGEGAAGVGSGDNSACGDIAIQGGQVVATSGNNCNNSIGAGSSGTCGTVSTLGMVSTTSGKTMTVGPWDGDLSVLADNDEVTAFDGTVIRNTLTHKAKISIADNAYVTLSNATIQVGHSADTPWAGITCLGDAHIELMGVNRIRSCHNNYPGIFVTEGYRLAIEGHEREDGTIEGSLEARCNSFSGGYGAGIGGAYEIPCGSVEIFSGTITANGAYYAAGIGGAGASCGYIGIYGGTVTATSFFSGAGIGSGSGSSATCGRINIEGGTVRAEGGEHAAGIGTGPNGTCERIVIHATVTKVTAYSGSNCETPIGAGDNGTVDSMYVDESLYETNSTSSGKKIRILEGWNGNLSTLTHDATAADGTVIYGTLGGNYKVSIAADATVTLSNAVINGVNDSAYPWAGLTCLGSATITLEGTNTITGFHGNYPGIYVPHTNGNYYCGLDIQGDGKLTVSSHVNGAGIGGGKDLDCGGIQIWSGTIIANGGFQGGPGIGGGWASQRRNVDCLYIIIYGGTITATGGWGAAGIGGGANCDLYGGITINGGSVTATGGLYAPGIGSGKGNGEHGTCDAVYIDNGNLNPGTWVVATRGNNCENAIGAGSGGSCPTVSVLSDLLIDDEGDPTRTIAPWDGNLSLLNGTGEVTALNGTVIRGTLASGVNYKINIVDGAEVVLRDATITGGFNADAAHEHAGLTCLGDATIVLEGSNTVKGFHNNYSAIYVPEGCTLVIDGDGALRADVSSTSNYAAAIGGGRFQNCGNIDIEGGSITALGGYYGVGIGGAYRDSTGSDPVTCGDITIGKGIICVTATRGTGCTEDPIGPGKNCSNYDEVDVNVAQGLNNSLDGNTRTIWRWDGNLATLTGNVNAADGTVIYGTMSGNYKVSIAADATVTLSNAVINGVNNSAYPWAGLTCLGSAEIVLAGGSVNTITGFYDIYPGIYVPVDDGSSSCTLTISGTGTLNASSTGDSAGIGGGRDLSCGNIVIDGGTINATGRWGGAGIGAGRRYQLYSCSCGTITINGGTITATGGWGAAGIGGGMNGSDCGEIVINGGRIVAQGDNGGAGIGGGSGGDFMNILIYGGDITATGGSFAPGIGTGKNGDGWTIAVESDVTRVVATHGSDCANAIGAGSGGTCETPQISSYLNDDHGDPTRTISSVQAWDGNLAELSGDVTIDTDMTIYGTLGGAYKVSIADGVTVTLSNAVINSGGSMSGDWAGLTCLGSAEIVLAAGSVNTINGFHTSEKYYPGIYVPVGYGLFPGFTLTISGTGTLNAIGGGSASVSGGYGAGIGGGQDISCGSIVINGGVINATGGDSAAGIGAGMRASCDDIVINGGTVTATGGYGAAGIGSGFYDSDCVGITIGAGIVRVTATRGSYEGESPGFAIGNGFLSDSVPVTVHPSLTDDQGTSTRTIVAGGSSSGYAAWATANGVSGAWNAVDGYGIANVFRYAFNKPTGAFTTPPLLGITFNAAGKAVILTPALVNSSGFTFTVEASDNVDGTGTPASYPLNASGETTINETGKTKRFFRLKVVEQ